LAVAGCHEVVRGYRRGFSADPWGIPLVGGDRDAVQGRGVRFGRGADGGNEERVGGLLVPGGGRSVRA
jgi:hypothetical protein